MSLKLHLKPNEKVIIGGAVIKCGVHSIDFIVENNVPILRQKDIMTEVRAVSPSKRIYFLLQLMYVDESEYSTSYYDNYIKLEQEIVTAAPSTIQFFERINKEITSGKIYQALKIAQELIHYEQELMAQHTNLIKI